jgi:mannose-6-phosphate isomerase-like protein (cupin superfamily)
VFDFGAVLLLPLLAISLSFSAQAEIRDVLKSAEIDAMLARASRDTAIHERPHYAIWLLVRSGEAGRPETHQNIDEILFVRRGSAVISLASTPGPVDGRLQRLEAGAGDLIKIPAGALHQIDPLGSRFESLAVRIASVREGVQARTGIRPVEHQMPDLLKKSEIDGTFTHFDSNQPIHAAPNFTMNYVIYTGHGGPWEAHAGCVDIYFLKVGIATGQIGGEIKNAKEDIPGEPRGDGVSGERSYPIGPGDVVVIPRNTTHHMEPGAEKLGYVLIKVWVD